MTKILSLISFLFLTHNFIWSHTNIFFVDNKLFSADTIKSNNISHVDSTLSIVKDSIQHVVTKLNPIEIKRLTSEELIVNHLTQENILNIDYRYSGNFFSYFPFGFVKDLGAVGQPNEILLYGQGFNNSTYLINGISINNRLNNSFDLNLIPSESIGEIELIPFVQGFLYGPANNPVAVNFIPKDFYQSRAFTRIRFYQGANAEGLIDGIFSTTFSNKFSVFAEFTNQSSDPVYKNSDFGVWLGSARLRYLLSDKINFTASYRYANSQVQLNGGINFDSIKTEYAPNRYNEILYDKFLAPVNFINRYQKTRVHDFNFTSLMKFYPDAPTRISFYLQTSSNEFRQNERPGISNYQIERDSIYNNNNSRSIGLKLDQNLNLDFARFDLSALYDHAVFNSPHLTQEEKRNTFYVAAKTSFDLINNKLIPTLFGKHFLYNDESFNGFGADIIFKFSESINFYAGYSQFEKPKNLFEEHLISLTQKINNAEFRVSFTNAHLKIHAGLFNKTTYNQPISVLIKNLSIKNVTSENAYYYTVANRKLNGFNFVFDIRLWKLLIKTNSNYYLGERDIQKAGLPQFTSQGGIYYIDTLFNNNLKLKTGINYWTIGSRFGSKIDFEKNISTPYNWFVSPWTRSFPILSDETFDPEFQLDFFLAGQIQEKATVYLVFENLLNSNYFITPYYPMRQSSFRIGVAWEFLD